MSAPDFTLTDQADADWTLSEHRDAATVLVSYRGDGSRMRRACRLG